MFEGIMTKYLENKENRLREKIQTDFFISTKKTANLLLLK